MSKVKTNQKPKQNFYLKNIIDWATGEDNFDRAIDSVIAKIDSGELTADDLPNFGLLADPKKNGAH